MLSSCLGNCFAFKSFEGPALFKGGLNFDGRLLKIIGFRKQCFSKLYALLKSDSHLPKTFLFICFNESPLKLMKNGFYIILKALSVLMIFTFLS